MSDRVTSQSLEPAVASLGSRASASSSQAAKVAIGSSGGVVPNIASESAHFRGRVQ